MTIVVIIGLIVAAVIYALLRYRENVLAGSGGQRLAGWRLILATFAAMVALFTGGCALMLLPQAATGHLAANVRVVLLIGGLPFLIAVLVFWFSMRRPRS
jgi:uncharacterized membrane protein